MSVYISRIRTVGPEGRKSKYILLPSDLRKAYPWLNDLDIVRITIEGRKLIIEPVEL